MQADKLHILIVDDDVVIGPVVKDYLESKGFEVVLVQDSRQAIKFVNERDFNACILDVKMPGKTGFELAGEMNEKYPELPFLFLTGESGKAQKIEGFTLGADDYIIKPFNLEELYLRLKVVTRRSKTLKKGEEETGSYMIGSYLFDSKIRVLKIYEESYRLSAIENELLLLFCISGMKIDRETALKKIWKDEYMFKGRSLNVYISKLRKYLKSDDRIEILNIHGAGYSIIVK